MTRVLHLITRYLDGGAETTTRNTLEALKDAGYELRLGTGNEHDRDRLQELEHQGIETVIFRTIRHYNPFAAVIAVFEVAWYLYREEIEVLHTHSTEAGIIGRWAGQLANTPVIFHEVHGDPITNDRNPLINRMLLFLERVSAPLADQIIVKAERIGQLFLKRGIGTPEQYTLIYHGVPISRFKTPQLTSTADCRESNILLYVGRLEDGKGLLDLLDAVQGLNYDIELLIAGDGPMKESLRTEIEKRRLRDQVTLLGYREDIPLLLARADIFVLPSYREGTPRVITEALISGTPVVSTRIAGIPEQVRHGENGYLIEPGDIDALVAHLDKLISDSELRNRFGERGTVSIEKFAAKRAQREYLRLYQAFLRNSE